MYRVTLKPGHPKGVYHRSGRAFTKEPVHLSEKEMTQAIRDDTIWLNVEEMGEEPPSWPTGADELITYIMNHDDAEDMQAILDWEMEGKQRVTVIKAAGERLEELVAAAEPQADEPPEGGGP